MPEQRILLVLTGGTIGSQRGPDKAVDLAADQLVALSGPKTQAYLDTIDFDIIQPINKLSEDIQPEDWQTMTYAIKEARSVADYSGVLILHGTDTMSYTSAALSFLLTDIEIPVVLTGSSNPPETEGSDADQNVSAALLALEKLPEGVYIVFADDSETSSVHLGTRVRKTNRREAVFETINGDPVAKITEGLKFVRKPSVKEQTSPVVIREFKKAFGLQIYPGICFDTVFNYLKASRIAAVAITLYPAITAPAGLKDFLESCKREGILVSTTVTRLPDEISGLYESTRYILKSNFLLCLPETAYVKSLIAVSAFDSLEAAEQYLREEKDGEFSGFDYSIPENLPN